MSANICYAKLVLTHYQPWQICIGEDFEYQGKSNKLWDWSSCHGIGYGVEMDCYNGIKSDNCQRSYSESCQCHMLSRSPCLSSFGNSLEEDRGCAILFVNLQWQWQLISKRANSGARTLAHYAFCIEEMEQSLLVRIPGKLERLNFWWSKSNSIPWCPPHSNSPDFVVLNWHFLLHFDQGLPQNTCPEYEPKPQTLLAANFSFLHCELMRPFHSQYWLSLLIRGTYLHNRGPRCQLSCQR